MDFIGKDEWPPTSPDMNPLDSHVWGAMLDKYHVYTPKPTNKAELKLVLQSIWNDLLQHSIDKDVLASERDCRRASAQTVITLNSSFKSQRPSSKSALFRASHK